MQGIYLSEYVGVRTISTKMLLCIKLNNVHYSSSKNIYSNILRYSYINEVAKEALKKKPVEGKKK